LPDIGPNAGSIKNLGRSTRTKRDCLEWDKCHTSIDLVEMNVWDSQSSSMNVPIIVLAPVDRDLEERENKYPRIEDLPGMGAIANAADLVLFLYRDEVYDPESEKRGLAEVIISRNRGGSIGGFQLKYDAQIQRFMEMQCS